MVTIKKASELTGVPEHTLRAWERRYDLLAPARSAGGYRVYDDQALARITAMNELVQAGWTPRAAAAEVASQPLANGRTVDPFAELLAVAAELDAAAVTRVIDERFAHGSFEAVVDHWLLPAMRRIGTEWAEGRASVAAEHLVSNVVMRRLSAAYEAAGGNQPGPPVLIGAPPGVDHQIGLLAFAVALRRVGVPTIYLGAQVPLTAWREAADASGARAAVTTAHRSRDVPRARRVVECLAEDPRVPVWVGGRYQHLIGGPELQLGHSIATGAATLAHSGETSHSDDAPVSGGASESFDASLTGEASESFDGSLTGEASGSGEATNG